MRRLGIVPVLALLALGGGAGLAAALPAPAAGATCSAAGPLAPGFMQPVPVTTCTRSVSCPDGSRVSCSTPFTNDCAVWEDCTTHVRCGVECVGVDTWCAGFDNHNCGCWKFQ